MSNGFQRTGSSKLSIKFDSFSMMLLITSSMYDSIALTSVGMPLVGFTRIQGLIKEFKSKSLLIGPNPSALYGNILLMTSARMS